MPDVTNNWPVLRHYEGASLREIAFPLGGIGTGTVSLGGRADLRDFEIFNQPAKGFTPPCTFFALHMRTVRGLPVTRVLEGVLTPPYSGAFGLDMATAGLPRMRSVALEAAYPFARFTLSDPDVPAIARLEAFNPFIPLDVDRSSLPVAVLRWVLSNSTDETIRGAVCGSLMNFIGVDIPCCANGPSASPAGLTGALGGNVNEPRTTVVCHSTPLAGLLMRSEKVVPRSPQDGTLALAAITDRASFRRGWGQTQWNRHILAFWDDFSTDGQLDDPDEVLPSPTGQGQVGSVAVPIALGPYGQATVTFILSWHFPHRTAAGCGWDTLDEQGGYLGNYYAQRYANAWDVATDVAAQLPQLEQDSLQFVHAVVSSNIPRSVQEAALNNVSTLRTQTCFRTADGNFFGFEGSCDRKGCCFGSCTHVWNYEQVTPFLFPQLARNMRELELTWGTDDNGRNSFRLRLPLGQPAWPYAAADGQMGVVMKCYREWQLSGDSAFLSEHWPTIKSLLEYCWLPGSWDADQDGVMEGVQHNTYDVEFFGPNPLTGIWYLGALRAAEEMARAVSDMAFADRCRELFERGSASVDATLFNGEYYVQRLRIPPSPEQVRAELRVGMGAQNLAEPEYQLGTGCLVDQLVGQYMAHVLGLGYLLSPAHVKKALQSLFRYNFRQDLYGHWNNMRTFALNDESGLLICTWPHGSRPKVPFPYFAEVMTGLEYQAAALMIYEDLLEEGLTIVEAIRQRFDGERRNPWNEQECGHHYVRAMASWALLLAISGFHYSAVDANLALAPHWRPDNLRCPWFLPTGWGILVHNREDHEQAVRWEVLAGHLSFRSMEYRAPQGKTAVGAHVEVAGQRRSVALEQDGDLVKLTFDKVETVERQESVLVRLEFREA